MKKEIVIAILIGLSLGLFITYGVYQAKTGIDKKADQDQKTLALTPAPDQEFAGELILNSPNDETIQLETATSVSGTTLPSSFVVVFVGNNEKITTSDESGNFSVEVELETGANIITVVVLDENGRSISLNRTVIVSDEPLIEEATSSAEEGNNE
ncbi:MAG: hypothetical protein IT416_00945 [Candidatus Pacebacteria bacterium]|nr:hypothetical protein [Candidatus Paceibacterota bacterium]